MIMGDGEGVGQANKFFLQIYRFFINLYSCKQSLRQCDF